MPHSLHAVVIAPRAPCATCELNYWCISAHMALSKTTKSLPPGGAYLTDGACLSSKFHHVALKDAVAARPAAPDTLLGHHRAACLQKRFCLSGQQQDPRTFTLQYWSETKQTSITARTFQTFSFFCQKNRKEKQVSIMSTAEAHGSSGLRSVWPVKKTLYHHHIYETKPADADF